MSILLFVSVLIEDEKYKRGRVGHIGRVWVLGECMGMRWVFFG